MAPKLRRPAAMPARARPLRRPGRASGEEETEKDKPITEEYHPLTSLTLDRMKELEIVELGETSYYGAHAKIAGRIRGLKPSEQEVEFELSGALTDRVLERFGGGSSRTVKVHACPVSCPQLMTGDTYFHARGFWDTTVTPKPWRTNLLPAKGTDEGGGGRVGWTTRAGLGERQREWRRKASQGGGAAREEQVAGGCRGKEGKEEEEKGEDCGEGV